MNTNTQLSPDALYDLCVSIEKHGHNQMRSFLKGESGIGSSANDEVIYFYDGWREANLPCPQSDEMDSKQWDQIYDFYMEGIKSAFRPVQSDPTDFIREATSMAVELDQHSSSFVSVASPSDKELLKEAREVLQILQTTLQNLHNDFKSGRALHPDNIVFGLKSNLISLEPTLKKLQSATR